MNGSSSERKGRKAECRSHSFLNLTAAEFRILSKSWWIGKYKDAAKSLQSCPTLCDPTDGSPPGSPVPGILQARTLEWAAISFSSA